MYVEDVIRESVNVSGQVVEQVETRAMPALDHGLANATQAAQPEQVRWVCGPYRCWWRPGPYWGPRPYWGWRRPYWGPRWGWRRGWW